MRLKIHILSVLAVLLFLPGVARSTDWAHVHEVTMRGVDLIYNLEMDRAITTFDSVIVMAPGDPRGYFFRSMVYFWIFTLRNGERDFERFIAASDTVVDICEGLVDQNEKDAVARFYLGGISGYRGLAYQLQGSMLKAVMEGKKGYSELEEAVYLQPDLYDAHMGFGLFRYLVAKVPRGVTWVVSLLGFEGDLKGGLESLKLAATKGVYTRSEAAFYLSQFLQNEHRRDESFALMRDLIRRHPDNTLFLVLYSSWQLRDGNLDEALDAIDKAAAVNSRKSIKYGEEYLFSTRAAIAYTRNNFATARKEYDRFLAGRSQRNIIPNFTFYRIAVSRDIMGDHIGAAEVCNMMKEPEGGGRGNDTYLYRKARELASRPLTMPEIRLIMASNASNRKAYDSALVYYKAALDEAGNNPELRARALYGLQEFYYDREKDTESLQAGLDAVQLKPVQEAWIIPHAYFKLAQSYDRMGRKDEALRMLDKADEFDDYEFQKSLEDRIKEERKKLKE